MHIDPTTLDRRDRYRLLISCVIPRPICWISTLSRDGVPNLAPFSFFGGVTSEPPTVMVSVGRRQGVRKDTAQNLLDTGEGVIHIAHRPLAEAMVASSVEVEADVSEFELAGLTPVPSALVKPSRIREAAIAMEARQAHHQEVGLGPVDLFLLEIVAFHLDEQYLRGGLPDPAKLAAVGRLGGTQYCSTDKPFDIDRPER